MKKSALLKIVNFCIALFFIIVAGTAMAITLFQAPVYVIHQYAGYAFVLFAALHVALNWAWIMSNLFKRSKPAQTPQVKK